MRRALFMSCKYGDKTSQFAATLNRQLLKSAAEHTGGSVAFLRLTRKLPVWRRQSQWSQQQFNSQTGMGYNCAMTDQSPKIITTFQSRLEMDAAVRGLGETSGDWELRQRAVEIAQRYGDRVLPALVAALDTSNPQLRGGLGHLAKRLDKDAAVSALSAAARNRSLPDQARLTAITILERFLEVTPDDAMYAGMAAPEQLALHSLHEVLADARSDRMVLVEYFRQLGQEPPDVQLTMVRAARLLDGAEGVELLSMFAQEPAQPVAAEALQTLGMIAEPAAAAALQGVIPSLPPELRRQAERSLQKLRLRGVPVPALPEPPDGARCLASAVSGDGHQMLWFFLPQAGKADGDVLEVLVNQQQGLAAAAGRRAVEAATLPERQTPGTLLQGSADQPLLLEAGFDYGRRRLLAALPRTWAAEQPTPLVYRLLGPQLWRWTRPESADALSQTVAATREDTVKLMQHPAMGSWFLQSRSIYARAERVLTGSEAPTHEAFTQMIAETLQEALDSGDLAPAALRARLEAMAEWFILANDADHADLAQAAAQTVEEDPASHPLLLLMSELGLRLAMINLARGLVPDLT
jgi:hypothetical protein